MIRVLTFIDMDHPATMYEVTRHVEDPDKWTMVKLIVGQTEAASETIPGETIHTGCKDEMLRLARILMATTNDELCEGCDTPLEKCGPQLWILGRKCCPDCNHAKE